MSTKRGKVAAVLKSGREFVQLRLSGGEKVEVPNELWVDVMRSFAPDQTLVFIERRGRLFRFVQWVGTDEQAREAVEQGVLRPNEYQADMAFLGIADEMVARMARGDEKALAAVEGEPWAAEAIRRRALARGRVLQLRTVFDSLDPIACLSFESLMEYGFTSVVELDRLRAVVRANTPPSRWVNPLILRDFEILDTPEDAMVRSGLWFTRQEGQLVEEPGGRPWSDAERELARSGYPHVARFVRLLADATEPPVASLDGQLQPNELRPAAARAFQAARTHRPGLDLETMVAAAIGHEATLAALAPRLQACILATGVALGVREELPAEDWLVLWRPFSSFATFAAVWSPMPGEPDEFRHAAAQAAAARTRDETGSALGTGSTRGGR